MTLTKWIVVALLAFSAIATVYEIGEYRKPITAGVAVGSLLLNAWIIYLISAVW